MLRFGGFKEGDRWQGWENGWWRGDSVCADLVGCLVVAVIDDKAVLSLLLFGFAGASLASTFGAALGGRVVGFAA